MTITLDQDIHLIRDVQQGMKSRGFEEAWLNDDEARVQHYHNAINAYMNNKIICLGYLSIILSGRLRPQPARMIPGKIET